MSDGEARRDEAFASDRIRPILLQAASVGVRVSAETAKGEPSQALARIGQEEACVLIVIGASHELSLGQWPLGATSEWLVRHCTTPVLFVRRRVARLYQSALACLAFVSSSQQALEHAVTLGLVDDGRLSLVHAYQTPLRNAVGALDLPPETVEDLAQTEGNAATDQAVAIVRALGLAERASRIYSKEGETYPMIAKAAEHAAADLLIMGSQGRAPLTDFFLGSTVKEALHRASCDILVKQST